MTQPVEFFNGLLGLRVDCFCLPAAAGNLSAENLVFKGLVDAGWFVRYFTIFQRLKMRQG
jgi:hypothetical protein